MKSKLIYKPLIIIFVCLLFVSLSFGAKAQTKADTTRSSAQVEKTSMIHTMVGYLDSLDAIRETIVSKAFPFIGTPYHYASAGPSSFDCSGFIQFVFSYFNMVLPHSAFLQSQLGNVVKLTEAIKGDLMFFGYHGKDGSYHVSHVGMVYSNKNGIVEMIHASSSEGVKIDRTDGNNWIGYWSKKFLFAKRVVD